MALITRRKPPVHNRKRQARHHRHSKLYLKAYHPYLPMLAIVGLGVLVNQFLDGIRLNPTAGLVAGGPAADTRVQVLAGHSNWALPLVIAITAAAAIVFVVAHWYRIRRIISRGEVFMIRHSWFDVMLLGILVTGVLLTRPV